MAGKRTSTTKDYQIYDTFIALKQHLGQCGTCRPAMTAKAYFLLCQTAGEMILKCALAYDGIVSSRISARHSDSHTFYPCPDITRHGRTFALTVKPVTATGYQGTLF